MIIRAEIDEVREDGARRAEEDWESEGGAAPGAQRNDEIGQALTEKLPQQ